MINFFYKFTLITIEFSSIDPNQKSKSFHFCNIHSLQVLNPQKKTRTLLVWTRCGKIQKVMVVTLLEKQKLFHTPKL